mgnify:CR=1 FL=1
MSSMATQVANTTAQSLLNFSKAQNPFSSAFSEIIDSFEQALSTNSSLFSATNTLSFNTSVSSGAFVAPWAGGGIDSFGNPIVYLGYAIPYATKTVSLSTLLSQNADSTLPIKAFDTSELSSISREQLEAISKDMLKTELKADDGFQTIFFRDAQSLEFTQDTLSKESIAALKATFGAESFLEREDGSVVLTDKAEKFISGWKKALESVKDAQSTLELLIKKDANFDGELSGDELGTQSVLQSTITTTIEVVLFLWVTQSVSSSSLKDTWALNSQSWEQFKSAFAEFFSEKDEKGANSSKSAKADESADVSDETSQKSFDKANFFYAHLNNSFALMSASFVGAYQAKDLSLDLLGGVVFDLAQTSLNLQSKFLTQNKA